MKVIIDRFEGDYAVCEKENREVINIERSRLPEGTREGDVLIIEDGEISVDNDSTMKKQDEIKKLMDDLWE